MKIACLSDLHGILPPSNFFEDDCEVLVLCGDILPLVTDQNILKSREWFTNEFKTWCDSLPFEKIFFIAGNHDKFCELNRNELENLFSPYSNITYLHNSGINYLSTQTGKIYRLFGSPYCGEFGNWSFMHSEEKLRELYEDIPEELDLLITHDAPYGVSDQVGYGGYYMRHAGNNPLRESILEKNPRYVIHGHLHTSNHKEEILGNSKIYNTSLVDESYSSIFKPLYLYL